MTKVLDRRPKAGLPAVPQGGPVVALKGVTKHYRGGGGVEDLSFEVARGEVLAVLGPNGAGKTTTIRLLLDLIRPDAGTIRLFGADPRRQGVIVRRRLGYLPGELALYDRLTARELLTHFAHLRGGPPWSGIAPLLERFDLEVDRPIRALSRGNRQKVGIVQALMGRPDLVILDEPTSGLDPLVQQQVHAAIREVAASGRSVFLSSHVLSEVAVVADRVALIRAGRVAALERIEDLRAHTAHLVDAELADEPGDDAFAGVPGVVARRVERRHVHLEVRGPLDPVVRALAERSIVELSVRQPDLEEVVLAFYREPEELNR